jgi:hypothetical protein
MILQTDVERCQTPSLASCSVQEPGSTCPFNLIAPAFPALKHLYVHLNGANLGGKGGLLDCLQGHPTITSLHLHGFNLQEEAVQEAASDLASLPSLVDLELEQQGGSKPNPASLVAQLTGLTRLGFGYDGKSRPMFEAAAHNPHLRSLHVDSSSDEHLPAAPVGQMLQACSQLTHLSFGSSTLGQDVLDLLLADGSHVTSMTAGSMTPAASMAGRQWGVIELNLQDENAANTRHLAGLPLQTVTRLEFARSRSHGLGFLELPMGEDNESIDSVFDLLRQAAINLAACPAWQAQPASKITLFGDPAWSLLNDIGEVTLPEESFTAQQALDLFESLAPLGGPHVTEVELCIDSMCFDLGSAEVEALGRSVRGGHAR